jgi:hypothetical protein
VSDLVIKGAASFMIHHVQSTFQSKSYPGNVLHRGENGKAPHFAGKPNPGPYLLEIEALFSFLAY